MRRCFVWWVRLSVVLSVAAALVTLGACGSDGVGGDAPSDWRSGSSSSSGSSSGASSSSGSGSSGASATVTTSASNKVYWNRSLATQVSLQDASGNAVTGVLACASTDTSKLEVAADCSSATGKRLGVQTMTVTGGGVTGQASIKVIPQPQPIGTHGTVSSFGVGDFNMVVTTDGRVLAWGANPNLVLGQGTSGNQSLPIAVKGAGGQNTLAGIVAVSAGLVHALALSEDGEVYSWGGTDSSALQLGRAGDAMYPGKVLGPDGQTPLQHVVAVSMGDGNAVALTDDGSVYAWGSWIGSAQADSSAKAIPVPSVDGSGNLTGGVAVSAGAGWTLALLGDGRVVSWGLASGVIDALGHGSAATHGSNTPAYVVTHSGQPVGDAVAISAGYGFGLALSATGRAYAWGEGASGQLGQGTDNKHSYSAVVVKSADGSGTLDHLAMIAAGGAHVVALSDDGKVLSWGNGTAGQLGDGAGSPRLGQSSLPAPVVAQNGFGQLGGVVSIAVGYVHSLALASDGSLLIWGQGAAGNLGQGSTSGADASTPLAVKNEAGTGLLNLGPLSYWPNLTQRAR